MNLLSLVREATKNHTDVNYVDGYYIFGKHRFHESTKTAFKRTLRSGGHYTLRDVIFFLENADLPLSEYRQKVQDARVTAVVVQDQSNLKKYLTGEIDHCDQIDLSMVNAGTSDAADADHAIRQTAGAKLAVGEMEKQRKKFADILEQNAKSSWTFSESMHFNFDPEFITADTMYLRSLRSDELPATNRSMVLCKPGADFSFALKLVNDHVLRPAEPPAAAPTSSSSSDPSKRSRDPSKEPPRGQHRPGDSTQPRPQKMPRTSGSSATSSSRGQQQQHIPASRLGGAILIVPNSLSSVICSLNAMDFLRDGKYVSVDEKRAAGVKREPEQSFNYTLKSGKTVKFRVVDSPARLRENEWPLVAAVFAQGQAWQFKGWKWANPVELFSNVFGAHVTMDDREIDATIVSWNCRVFKLSRSKRHLDASTASEFWMFLEDYLTAKRPWLLQ